MDFDLNEEQHMWQEVVHDFVAREIKPMAHEVDEKGEFNWKAVQKMGPLGLLGLSVPEKYGGSGVDAVSAAIAIEEPGPRGPAPRNELPPSVVGCSDSIRATTSRTELEGTQSKGHLAIVRLLCDRGGVEPEVIDTGGGLNPRR